MHVRRFATLLLMENIILNINDNSKLLEYVLYHSYSDLLTEKLLQLLENVNADKKINSDDAKKIISNISCATCVDSDRNIDILKNEDENKIVSNIIKYKNKYREKVIEIEEVNIENEKLKREKEEAYKKIQEANKRIQETNIENEKIRKDKEKSDAEKNEVLKENERLINIIKKKETGDKIDKYRNMMRNGREGKIKRRNIKIIKIACVILVSALIFISEVIIFKNIDIIKIFMEKYFGGIMEFNIDLFKCISIIVGISFIIAFTFIIKINNSKNIVKKNNKKSDIMQNKNNYSRNNGDANNIQGDFYNGCIFNINSKDKKDKDKKQ